MYCLLITIAEHNVKFNDQTGTIKTSDATLEDRVAGFIYLYTHTYSMVQSPSWETNWFAASQKFPAFHMTRKFITALTSVRHLSLSWASPIQSI
jgi:hypothetical protein